MEKVMIFRQYHSDDERHPLRIPALVEVKDLSEFEISSLMDKVCENTGAGYRFGKEVSLSVLQDFKDSASHPFAYGKSAYLYVKMKDENNLVISAVDKTSDLGGSTVYSLDQFNKLLDQVTPENYTQRIIQDVDYEGAFGFEI